MELEGSLSHISVPRLLYLLHHSGRSGKLLISNTTEWALLWLAEGQVVSAIILSKADKRPLLAGEQAVIELFTWADGRYSYAPDPAHGRYPVTIRRSTSALITEAMERRIASMPALHAGEAAKGQLRAGQALLRQSTSRARADHP
jgi:hypothetical protein